ncbi:hypothetical protein NQ314_005249 [Rhamnusium bicolor]|uniref:Uncharacterized protein n=1 Tax=Rhamnusium bicolor TaxID=1586634 RepID=A0AAV8ZGX4_9CUCU|nr:hypothetical protein NQ314_005249 [Rhamnusium bicolor]
MSNTTSHERICFRNDLLGNHGNPNKSMKKTISGKTCVEILQQFPHLMDDGTYGTVVFHQDTAPPHFAIIVRGYLDEAFLGFIRRKIMTSKTIRIEFKLQSTALQPTHSKSFSRYYRTLGAVLRNAGSIFLTLQKQITILCSLLLAVSAGPKDKKTTLEDIERDYISNQKRVKLTPAPPPPPKVPSPAQSPTQFGFVPIKTIADYVQQGPKQNYVQPQYIQQFAQQYPETDYSQYATAQQYTSSIPQKYSSSLQQYSVPRYSSTQQKYVPQIPGQQSYTYVPQVESPYQSYDNLQYITDNSIGQPSSQYYTPQYVYLQQYQSPSTAVQTVVEPKGGLQYVMYIPTYVPTTEQTQNYENVIYTTNDAQDSSSAYQIPQTQAPQTTQYVQQNNVQEPKSLLDSYVPSILQLQYYKQAQQNSIQEPVKVSQDPSGKQYVKNGYRSAEPAGAGTSLTYRYQANSHKS